MTEHPDDRINVYIDVDRLQINGAQTVAVYRLTLAEARELRNQLDAAIAGAPPVSGLEVRGEG